MGVARTPEAMRPRTPLTREAEAGSPHDMLEKKTYSGATGTGPDGAPMACVNVRCLDDVDLGALKPTQHDGKSH